jgi:ATPase subunit of ABC transporter with duplicated ATPase domains
MAWLGLLSIVTTFRLGCSGCCCCCCCCCSAKIGILGVNGAGKSTFLKILGGVDTEYDGSYRIFPDMRVGYLHQEPVLDPELTVYENVVCDVKEQLTFVEQMQQVQPPTQGTD